MVNFEVATGHIGTVSAGPSRTEQDYLKHIQRTVEADPTVSKWHFIVDQLNIHLSESLVRYVAAQSDLAETELGVKGQSGILKSKQSRAEFLSKPEHRLSLHPQTRLLAQPD